MRAHGVLPSWKVRMMSARGMKSRVGGTRHVTKMEVPSTPAIGKRRRPRAYPARRPQNREMLVEMVEMKKVFHSHWGNVVLAIRSRKCSRVGCSVQKGVLLTARQERYSSASGRMEVTSIQ